MRHRKAGRKLSRDTSHRRAMLRNMVTSLFRYEEISTTHAKAKTARPIAEKMITLAKRGDLHARRQALSYIMDKSVTHTLFDETKDRFHDRQGGYVRILQTGHRRGDNAHLAIMQLVTAGKGKKGSEKASTKAAKGKKRPREKTTPKVKEPEDTQQRR
jgi:large subunit ribosomal protein L17